MSEEDYKHWKAYFDKDYLGSWSFRDNIAVVYTIDKMGTEKVFDQKTNSKIDKPVLYFIGEKLRMVMNTTNGEIIEHMHGELPSKWNGKRIAIYRTKTEKKVGGEFKDCLRVINKEPPAEPKEIDITAWQQTRMRRG